MASKRHNNAYGVQKPFELRPELQNEYPILRPFHWAMLHQEVLLPDGYSVKIVEEDLSFSTDEDVWADDYETLISPGYEQGLACFFETLVNADLCGASGEQRFLFVLSNLSGRRAKGDLFDWNCHFYDRQEMNSDWLNSPLVRECFSYDPRRCMNRLKERVYAPRRKMLRSSQANALVWRMAFLCMARKLFLARAGHREFAAKQV